MKEIPLASTAHAAQILSRADAHIHLIGIGGAGLSAIAALLLEAGYQVSGSDLQTGPTTEALRRAGATIYIGHAAGQEQGADLILISSAVPPDNPELRAALAAGIPVIKRAQFLGAWMRDRIGIAVAGTHGKTTTTAMIATTLMAAGLDPGFLIGGVPSGLEHSGHAGRGDLFVVEADEYDRMFLGLSPRIAVITNVEWDHVDCYPTPAAFEQAFRAFSERLPADGILVVCADDPGARRLGEARQAAGQPVITYGLSDDASWQARAMRVNAHGGTDCEIWRDGTPVASLNLRIPGPHNVLNALATLAVADALGIQPKNATANLKNFAGVRRRFEIQGMKYGIIVIDDYAHHPSEIQATLIAARQRYPERRIWVVFQPHTFSRTQALMHKLAGSFEQADHVLITDIYPARERAIPGVHASQLAMLAACRHPDVRYVGGLDQAVALLLKELRPGDVLLTLNAGDAYQVGRRVLAALQEPSQEAYP